MYPYTLRLRFLFPAVFFAVAVSTLPGCGEECETAKNNSKQSSAQIPEAAKNNVPLYILDRAAREIRQDIRDHRNDHKDLVRDSPLHLIEIKLFARLEEVNKQRQMIADGLANPPVKTSREIGLEAIDTGIKSVESQIKLLRDSRKHRIVVNVDTPQTDNVPDRDDNQARHTQTIELNDSSDSRREEQLFKQLLALHQARIELARISTDTSTAARYNPDRLEKEYSDLIDRHPQFKVAAQVDKLPQP
jgi:hypothetical protein